MAFKFEKLTVWQQAVDYTEKIHLTTLKFPKDELFGLSSQIKRAADSIALNIAEGSTGQSDNEFCRFLGISIRSGIEVISCLYIARKRRLVSEEEFQNLYSEAEGIIVKIQALRKSIKKETLPN